MSAARKAREHSEKCWKINRRSLLASFRGRETRARNPYLQEVVRGALMVGKSSYKLFLALWIPGSALRAAPE